MADSGDLSCSVRRGTGQKDTHDRAVTRRKEDDRIIPRDRSESVLLVVVAVVVVVEVEVEVEVDSRPGCRGCCCIREDTASVEFI